MIESKVKNKIFQYLDKRKTPASIKEIAVGIDMSYNTVRKHLNEMKSYTIVKIKRGNSHLYIREPVYYDLKKYEKIKKLEMNNLENRGTNKPTRIKVEKDNNLIRINFTFEDTTMKKAKDFMKSFNSKKDIFADKDNIFVEKQERWGTVYFIRGYMLKYL